MISWTRRDFIKTSLGALAALAFAAPRRIFGASTGLNVTNVKVGRVFRMAFGSCLLDSSNPAPLQRVVEQNPDVFVWLGDNIYADTSDPAVFRQKYATLAANPGFQALLNQCPNYASWDDHDFGLNDGGGDFTGKDIAKQAFLDFWQVPQDDARRVHGGVYYSQVFGEGDRSVRLIQLDNRYFRTNENAATTSILGEDQWTWLEDELRKPETLKIVTSGIVILPNVGGENWCHFPPDRGRLLSFIKRNWIEGVIFVSGDLHWSHLSVLTTGVYPLYELGASSFDQRLPIYASPLLLGDATNEPNFGMIEIDWADKGLESSITFQSYSTLTGARIRNYSIPLSDIRYDLPSDLLPPTPVEAAPIVVEPAPVVEEPAPVVVDPAPVVDEPTPVVVDSTPVVVDPPPVVVDSTPVAGDPPPVVVDPTPAPLDTTQVVGVTPPPSDSVDVTDTLQVTLPKPLGLPPRPARAGIPELSKLFRGFSLDGRKVRGPARR